MANSRKTFSSGRVQQKLRTRKAILEAAGRLLAATDLVPSLEAIAAEAMVSRATLYRYFPNLDVLLAEVPLDAGVWSVEQLFADLPESAASDMNTACKLAADRLERVQRHLHQLSRDHEVKFRVFLRGTMDRVLDHLGAGSAGHSSPPGHPTAGSAGKRPRLRQSRRLELISEALAPVRDRFDDDHFEQLVRAASLLVGIEPFIALTDVCELNPADSDDVGAWAVRTLLAGALAAAG